MANEVAEGMLVSEALAVPPGERRILFPESASCLDCDPRRPDTRLRRLRTGPATSARTRGLPLFWPPFEVDISEGEARRGSRRAGRERRMASRGCRRWGLRFPGRCRCMRRGRRQSGWACRIVNRRRGEK
jgi:hypothetical protein